MQLSDDAKAALGILAKLEKALITRAPTFRTYDNYYEGKHPLAFATEKFREAFGGLFLEFSDNWCELVVDAVEERLNVDGFRFGDELAGDKQAWRVWQANQMDAESQLAHAESLICSTAYGLVWPNSADEATPLMTVEHPTQVICGYEPGNRRKRVAALKMWQEDDGTSRATLYLPESIWKFQTTTASAIDTPVAKRTWVPREVRDEVWPLPNPLGVVPVVELPNKPRMQKSASSEIHKVIPVQDAINKMVADMLVASEFQSFRQRWVTGMEIIRDPETKQAIAPFDPSVLRLFQAEDTDAKFGEFGQLDLAPFTETIEMLVLHIASQTRTPPHYLQPHGKFSSGETIKSAEAGLVAKTKRKMRFFGEGWEELIRLALTAAGHAVGRDVTVETMWADPEIRAEGERTDAALKKKALNIPDRQLWEDLGYTETQIARFKEMIDEQVARSSVFGIGSPLFNLDRPR